MLCKGGTAPLSLRRVLALAVLLTPLALPPTPASAQTTPAPVRTIELTEGADYFGFDLRALKGVTLEQCSTACVDDAACRAFTYNTRVSWCFLKSDFGAAASVPGAVGGRIVLATPEPDIGPAPELSFLTDWRKSEARTLRRTAIRESAAAGFADAADLASQGRQAFGRNEAEAAIGLFRRAVGRDADNLGLWLDFARASLDNIRALNGGDYATREAAVSASLNAYRLSRTASTRAASLALLAEALDSQSEARPAIEAYKASVALVPDPAVTERLQALRAMKGFRVTGNTVDADAPSPRICVQFSEPLVKSGVDYSAFVAVEGAPDAPITASGEQVCAEGLRHGQEYTLTLRAGLPSSVDEPLDQPASITTYIRDRAPAVRFTGDNFVLPGAARRGIPIVGINADSARLVLHRVNDRGLADLLRESQLFKQLEGYALQQLAENKAETLWEGTITLDRALNEERITSFPVDEVVPERRPGIYVLTARATGDNSEDWQSRATQWFLVSDIGLTTVAGSSGLTVFARSLDSAAPLAGLEVALVARSNEVLGTALTDGEGVARFEQGLMLGRDARAPALVTARRPSAEGAGDFVFLDMTAAGFDLSDRGVTGRTAPGPVDVFAYLDRGVYRPGETVHAVALARDDSAVALPDLPLTFTVRRPDGKEAVRQVVGSGPAGGAPLDFAVPANAATGAWTLSVHTDPDRPAITEATFLVEEFIPDRTEFTLTAGVPVATPGTPIPLRLEGRFLYGAPAAGMALEGEVRLKPVGALPSQPGFLFGLADEEDAGEAVTTLADLPKTDAAGVAEITALPAAPPPTTRLLEAAVTVRMREEGGRAVERQLTLPVAPSGPMIGVRPAFGEQAAENASARFAIIAVDGSGSRIDLAGLEWSLSRIERTYQWYRDGGSWRFEPNDVARRVDGGAVSAAASGPVEVGAPVAWGRYRFEVAGTGAGAPITSVEFDAGTVVTAAAADTPDALDIALDKAAYRPGETATLKVSPRFAGRLSVVVGSDRLFETLSADIPATGGAIAVPVKAEWGAGAYLTAFLVRPGTDAASRMPVRAIGTQWLAIEPGDRRLEMALDLPEKALPGRTLTVPVTVGNLQPGESARITVAAVDVGILNLTRYEAPDPAGWYYGQRRLGLELRDIYGRLIDGALGSFGRLRTGGDGPGLVTEGSPPSEALLSLFSGIVEVGPDGRASVDFALPPFNGTARVMAVGWTRTAVGSASRDVVIRDAVALNLSLPRVLAPGDRTRVVLEVANNDGPAGDYALSVVGGEAVTLSGAPASLTLAAGERRTVPVDIEAVAPGVADVSVTLTGAGTQVLSQRTQYVTVRPATLPQTTRLEVALAPGAALTVDDGLLAQSWRRGSDVAVNISHSPGFDVAALLTRLDRYPYGCAEQTASRALPLLYLSELQAPAELLETPDLDARLDGAITRLLSFQGAAGGFGLWGPEGEDFWLDGYVTDFLTRAREKGRPVPDDAMRLALSNLQNKLGYQNEVAQQGDAIAYALYVLARNRLASVSDLRYYADAQLEEFRTPLARAQLAAALSLYNEAERAERAFAAALELARTHQGERPGWRTDYGSVLRDGAAMLALASESRPVTPAAGRMIDLVREEIAGNRATSTQEDAWLLLAARAVTERDATMRLSVDGATHTGALRRRLDASQVAGSPLRVTNEGSDQVTAVVTARAAPLEPPPAGGEGYEITRDYYRLDGTPATIQDVRQNERLVVVLTVEEGNDDPAQVLVTDLLPGGLEIDNPSLVGSASLEAFSWLPEVAVAHTEFRADRFVAALDRREQRGGFTLAYVVRAVSPGTYTHPAAQVEDMYRPERSARTAAGFMQVTAAQ